MNCSNTPERHSYYCKDHTGQDINLTFQINKSIISYKVNKIISKINTMLNDVTIHDYFRDNQNLILYLITGTV